MPVTTKKTATVKTQRRGGRPSQAQAARLREKIIDAAADVFFTDGYGAAKIESIAKRARIAKRTLYARFRDKSELFSAVVLHVLDSLRPPPNEKPFEGTGPETLAHIAQSLLQASLKPQAISMLRLILAEATRFPELAEVMAKTGAREEAIKRIAGLLEQEARLGNFKLKDGNARFAAEQFIQMVVSAPQRRALGLGEPMSQRELDNWARDTVKLFLDGCRNFASI